MKKFIIITIVLFASFSITSFSAHKFYIGVYQLDYKSDKKQFQITSRVFIDDMEKALEDKYKKKLNLATAKENDKANEFIKAYFKEKFTVAINSKPQEMKFLAK